MSGYNNGQFPYYQGPASTYGYAYGWPQQTAPQPWTQGWFAVSEPSYLKGAVVGAAVALVATNPQVQRAVVKGAVSLWASIQGGFEEMKEQIQDIKSEMTMQAEEDDAE